MITVIWTTIHSAYRFTGGGPGGGLGTGLAFAGGAVPAGRALIEFTEGGTV